MKRLFALSFLLSATSTLIATIPSFAQTVPILSGTLNTVNANPGYITSITSSTFLTPIGTVSINSNGFNGTLTNIIPGNPDRSSSAPVTGSVLGTTTPNNPNGEGMYVWWNVNSNFFVFTGTTNGASPNGAFINAPTNINAALLNLGVKDPTYAIKITGGSITLPAPPPPVVVVKTPVTCTNCLIVYPDLLISNLTLQYSPLEKPKYPQEYKTYISISSFEDYYSPLEKPKYPQTYKNDFSISSFEGGHILLLENK